MDAEFSSEIDISASGFFPVANSNYSPFSKPRAGVMATARQRAVHYLVGTINCRSRPSDMGTIYAGALAATMRGLVVRPRRRAVLRYANKAVNLASFPINAKLAITTAADGKWPNETIMSFVIKRYRFEPLLCLSTFSSAILDGLSRIGDYMTRLHVGPARMVAHPFLHRLLRNLVYWGCRLPLGLRAGYQNGARSVHGPLRAFRPHANTGLGRNWIDLIAHRDDSRT